MPPSDEIEEKVRKAVLDYVGSARDVIEQAERGSRLEEFYFAGGHGGFTQRHVPKPSETIQRVQSLDRQREDQNEDRIENIQNEAFEEVAEWMMETDHRYPPHPSIVDNIDSEEELVDYYINDLGNFAETVIDYQTGLVYLQNPVPHELIDQREMLDLSDEAFKLAFNTEFALRYPGVGRHKIILPLLSFHGFDDCSVELNPHQTQWQREEYEIELTTPIHISSLSEGERGGLATYVDDQSLRNEPHALPGVDGPEYKIQMTFEVHDRAEQQSHRHQPVKNTGRIANEVGSEVAYEVLTGLRLFKPSDRSVYLGPAYELVPNWHSQTIGVENIGFTYTHRQTKYRSSSFYSYSLHPHEVPSFESFWEEYRSKISEDGVFSNAIRRFNQIYRKNTVEDQLVDIFIGIESSLLADTDAMYSLRLPIRTVVVLQEASKYDSRYLYDFVRFLYQFRNNIVHNNQSAETLIQRYSDRGEIRDSAVQDDIDQYEFRNVGRYLLAKIILRYIVLHEASGKALNNFNRDILGPHISDLLHELPELENTLETRLEDRI